MGISETLKAMSDPIRRDILFLLKNKGKISAGDITKNFNITNAAISYHLNLLKKADLVFETKYKNYVYYQINTSIFEELTLWLKQFEGGKDGNKK
ncbi:ArsR family transcriptional regulator [Breznakia sp. PF5-3]|uniref:autorepressor SdpR family transcription factor n=1 Tax=unclassified Breznakia TaxID=2623764 RepID=UPI0024072C33|nr:MULTISPECIES: autorepressor SdpR family transcription factor [unclassified Breznakia]MDL2276234.1 autorepressor SdpR family transcription factor [Breznakia sp. OttesenSCG-928-G09]MDF9824892.1 ArsR family transcriptional regulator [Breznakia sp. PM6-1]MDF9835609.1 ArsR family transcriptional regulator [Breznakia sp. PF5-3]MDF9837975.1 ArsR family transcriptional regulator [Breznakia sp. PFB2-8]MDF9859964.1 ArsR family transcriptional regulator [Breznakia sp. PH5-24]